MYAFLSTNLLYSLTGVREIFERSERHGNILTPDGIIIYKYQFFCKTIVFLHCCQLDKSVNISRIYFIRRVEK